jgi:Holliday junction resolvase RusA-like endonuclease
MRFVIPDRLPGLNDYTKANRTNKYAGAKMKSDTEKYISLYIPNWATYKEKVIVEFRWFEKDERRDPDNIVFAKKFILDALVAKGVLRGDSMKYVIGFVDAVNVDKKNPRIEIDIHEVTI